MDLWLNLAGMDSRFVWVGDLVVLEDLVRLGWTFGWAGYEIRLS